MKSILILLVALLVALEDTCGFSFGVHNVKTFNGNGFVKDNGIKSTNEGLLFANTELYFEEQKLDHFNPQNKATWRQRYFVNSSFWAPNGPVFIYIGGEGAEDQRSVSGRGFINVLAKEHGALVVCAEHRFYGKSWPTADMSTSNLRYLHSAQALADLALFRAFVFQKYNVSSDAKVVTFGGSYPGSLSAWFRTKYPQLVTGAVASSAPVRAELDFSQYMEVVGQALRYYGGDQCYDDVKAANDVLTSKLTTAAGRAELASLFNVCADGSDLAKPEDAATFLSVVMGAMQGLVQYNRVVCTDGPDCWTVARACDAMAGSPSDTPETRLARLANLTAATNGFPGPAASCADASYSLSIAQLRNTTFDADGNSAMRQWTYQTCTEFGYYQTTASAKQPYAGYLSALAADYYQRICEDAFGPGLKLSQTEVDWTNTFYGGHSNNVADVFFVNGNIDPWHALSVLEPNTPGQLAVYINGTAHCGDMYAPQSSDVPSLRDAHRKISDAVRRWVQPVELLALLG